MASREHLTAVPPTLFLACRAGLAVSLFWLAALQAQTAKPDDEPVRLDKVTVRGDTVPDWLDAATAKSTWSIPPSLAALAEGIPGLAMHRMGAAAAEPVLRGLGSDRVITILDGLPLPNASPTRTASPLALIGGGLTSGLAVSKALPSVTLGPPANAGYIDVSPVPVSAATDAPTGCLAAAWNLDREGFEALAVETAREEAWRIRATLSAHSLGDYTAGDGTVVPARDRNVGAALRLNWQPDSTHRFRLGALFSRQVLAVNSALPLDTRDTNTTALTAGFGWTASPQTSIDVRLGIGNSRPHLDNAGRPAASRINADGRTLSLAAGLAIRHKTDAGDEIMAGFDATQEKRRLERKRPGAVDLLWPDLRQDDIGGFAELTRALTTDWKLRLGARIDATHSEARAADGLAFNRTIRDLYAAYNGAGAVHTGRGDTAGAANALLIGRLARDVTTSFGVGFSRQPPGVSERYRAFSDALGGGYEIGNPTAGPEEKYELAWGLHWQRATLAVNWDLFASLLPNYLHRTRVGVTTAPSPPPPGSIVYGYRATRAEFWGGELQILWQPRPGTWWRLAASGVEGTDRNAHRRLPEIPPATLSLATGRTWSGVEFKPWLELELHATAARRNPAPDETPVFADTSAYTLGNIRGGFTWRSLRVALSVENLFDRLYYEYLSPPAASTPPGGSLRPGARIPGPGRTFLLTLRYDLP